MEFSLIEVLGVIGGLLRLGELFCEAVIKILKGGKNGESENNHSSAGSVAVRHRGRLYKAHGADAVRT